MRLIVQKTDEAIIVGGCMKSLNEARDGGCETLVKDGPSVFEMAVNILERFPRFKEVIINTVLTEDGEIDY